MSLQVELDKVIEHLKGEFAKLQVGRANPAIVEGVMVDAYGWLQPLKNLANVGTLDAQTLSIQPWDKGLLRAISKGISDSALGLNPQDNGESIMIKIPPLTTERRASLAKVAKGLSEDTKVSIRNVRQDAIKKLEAQKDELSEDIIKSEKEDIQKHIDSATKYIDEITKQKEADIMKI
jgi:ribosome recycling factor